VNWSPHVNLLGAGGAGFSGTNFRFRLFLYIHSQSYSKRSSNHTSEEGDGGEEGASSEVGGAVTGFFSDSSCLFFRDVRWVVTLSSSSLFSGFWSVAFGEWSAESEGRESGAPAFVGWLCGLAIPVFPLDAGDPEVVFCFDKNWLGISEGSGSNTTPSVFSESLGTNPSALVSSGLFPGAVLVLSAELVTRFFESLLGHGEAEPSSGDEVTLNLLVILEVLELLALLAGGASDGDPGVSPEVWSLSCGLFVTTLLGIALLGGFFFFSLKDASGGFRIVGGEKSNSNSAFRGCNADPAVNFFMIKPSDKALSVGFFLGKCEGSGGK